MKTIKRNNGNHIKIYATTLEDVAFEQIKELGEFREQMKDIYSTSVLTETLDEAPDAYKSYFEHRGTADVVDIIKPIYNFKAH